MSSFESKRVISQPPAPKPIISRLDSLQRRQTDQTCKMAACLLKATVEDWWDPCPFPQNDYAHRLRLSNNIRRQRERVRALGVEV